MMGELYIDGTPLPGFRSLTVNTISVERDGMGGNCRIMSTTISGTIQFEVGELSQEVGELSQFVSTYWTHELHWRQQRIDRHMTRCAAHRERRRRRGR